LKALTRHNTMLQSFFRIFMPHIKLIATVQRLEEVSIGIRRKRVATQKSYQYNLKKEKNQSIVIQFGFAFINNNHHQYLV